MMNIKIPIVLVGFGYGNDRLQRPTDISLKFTPTLKLVADPDNKSNNKAIKVIYEKTGKYVYVSNDTLSSFDQYRNILHLFDIEIVNFYNKSIKANAILNGELFKMYDKNTNSYVIVKSELF